MKTYGLVGKSGTGKSYQAINVCRDRDIEAIVDDGLLIFRDGEMVGRSAKRQPTKIGATKTALFTDKEHRREVRDAIQKAPPASVLILGTSESMIERIAATLGLAPVSEMIHIEDITTDAQRELAQRQRDVQGKHVVPVPTAKLKKQFSGYFMAPIRRFWWANEEENERTVVRPTYSYLGEFYVAPQVITDIVELVAADIFGMEKILKVSFEKPGEDLSVRVAAVFNLEEPVPDTAMKFQERLALRLEEMTAFSIGTIDVEIREVVFHRRQAAKN